MQLFPHFFEKGSENSEFLELYELSEISEKLVLILVCLAGEHCAPLVVHQAVQGGRLFA